MRYLLNTALAALVTLSASAAHAADEEVVVTATRSQTPVSRLPARIEVISRDEIEAGSLVTLSEAVGASAVQAGGAGQQASLFLRGASSKHVLALFDGIRLNDASTPNAQYDFGLDTLGAIERVEVLRGPASSLYGSDAIGGVVNLIPRRGGQSDAAGFFQASLGSFDTHHVLLGAAGDAAGTAYGISAENLETGGFDLIPHRMATFDGESDGARLSTFTLSARREGTIAWDVLLRLRDSETEFDTFSGGPFFDLRAEDGNLGNVTEQGVWRLGLEQDVSPSVTLRLSGGQVLAHRSEYDEELQTSAAQSTHDFADLVVTYRAGAKTLTAGAAFASDSIETSSVFADRLHASEDQASLYAVSSLDFTTRISVNAAVRADYYEGFDAHLTYSAGLVADFAPVRLFASYGTAFKAPSLSERFETSSFNVGNPALDAERSRSWELGADWSMREGLRVGGSLFRTEISDLIEYDFGQMRNVNIGRAAIHGAEAYAEASAAEWASLRMTYAWTDARNALTDLRLARRPEHAWSLDLTVRPHDRLLLTAHWTRVGERTDVTYGDDGRFLSSAGIVEGFSTSALAATLELAGSTQIFMRIDNATDASFEQPAAFAGAPRNVTFGLRARF